MPRPLRSFGGGYTARAIVAEVQPIHQPQKTRRVDLCVARLADAPVKIHRIAHATAQPIEYAV
ncbi:MAG TPA: hypothetical protein VN845_06465 [Solirubrobacteraceae bacterium]|nr:hypothetical protein [Solirubrobacteraceae bacterium]